MTLRRRLDRLEHAAVTQPDTAPPRTYTLAELRAMSPPELLRRHREMIRRFPPDWNWAEHDREVEELNKLPHEELRQLHREALGGPEW